MEWDFVEPLIDKKSVEKFEKVIGYTYPDSFKELVKKYNAGAPDKDVFDTETDTEKEFGYLISFNETDNDSVWSNIDQSQNLVNNWLIEGLDWRYVPFADDPGGNWICFDRTNDHVVYFNHELWKVEEVAPDFTAFINSLYEVEY